MEKFIELFANLFDETDINVFTPQTKFKESAISEITKIFNDNFRNYSK